MMNYQQLFDRGSMNVYMRKISKVVIREKAVKRNDN